MVASHIPIPERPGSQTLYGLKITYEEREEEKGCEATIEAKISISITAANQYSCEIFLSGLGNSREEAWHNLKHSHSETQEKLKGFGEHKKL